ncbi:hypothetical protein EB093_01850 [bacterium]|nr:hypothetical protein [bacterium]
MSLKEPRSKTTPRDRTTEMSHRTKDTQAFQTKLPERKPEPKNTLDLSLDLTGGTERVHRNFRRYFFDGLG